MSTVMSCISCQAYSHTSSSCHHWHAAVRHPEALLDLLQQQAPQRRWAVLTPREALTDLLQHLAQVGALAASYEACLLGAMSIAFKSTESFFEAQ